MKSTIDKMNQSAMNKAVAQGLPFTTLPVFEYKFLTAPITHNH